MITLLVFILAGVFYLSYLFWQLRDRVNHIDDWLYDHFSEEKIVEMATKEFYILKKKEEEDEQEES